MNAAKGRKGRNLLGLFALRMGAGSGARGTQLLVSVAVCAVFAAAAYVAWQQWGAQLTAGNHFQLSSAKMEVTAPPEWLRTDIKGEVIRDGSLDELNLLDPNVTVQVAQAFALHPWVRRVVRVRKVQPAQVIVDLEYRKPIAMVQAPGGGFWPVDTDGALLPPEAFSPQQTRNYLRVMKVGVQPAGLVGTSYGDTRVAEAALLAIALEDHRWELGIEQIEVSSGADTAPYFILTTSDGRARVIWGRAPGKEGAGEASASEKIARLREFVQQAGPLNRLADPVDLDVRGSQAIQVTPRTASQPTPRAG